MDSGELDRLYRSFWLAVAVAGGGGVGFPFRAVFPYSGSGQTNGRPVHPFAFVSLRRQGFVSREIETVDWEWIGG